MHHQTLTNQAVDNHVEHQHAEHVRHCEVVLNCMSHDSQDVGTCHGGRHVGDAKADVAALVGGPHERADAHARLREQAQPQLVRPRQSRKLVRATDEEVWDVEKKVQQPAHGRSHVRRGEESCQGEAKDDSDSAEDNEEEQCEPVG